MKVLITGATGLVGRALTDLCHKDGISVHYLTTSKDKIEDTPNYKGFYWNTKTDELDEACFEGVETIIHLAGASIAQRWTPENKKAIFESRATTARLLYSALSRKRSKNQPISIKHYISASAVGGYPSSFTKMYDESYPEYAKGFLGQVVEEWEKAALEFQKLDIITSRVRTGIILDKDSGALPKIMQPVKYGAGAPLGSGKQWQSWIHVDDMAGIYFHILKNKLAGIYNGVAPHPVTNKKLTEVVADTMGKPLIISRVPKFALKLMLGDMAAIVLESQKVSALKIKTDGYQFKYPKIDKAIESLLD
ncbi:TIGR01777 family protein [Dokdonia sp. Dokd-P16]|uniref:TIGR01777 family oxidoreductase n=1 Tax=Dokdonia sp. Dokd-P16 TaxID=2173169 RepID=UPI000D54650F|nr:TIGR01777 family oxidoreductase [Dokdonia sp. Dokd-P16]AWH72925.1 TIGR01777 family protein [Dokdonia sp. Dokd-P16]